VKPQFFRLRRPYTFSGIQICAAGGPVLGSSENLEVFVDPENPSLECILEHVFSAKIPQNLPKISLRRASTLRMGNFMEGSKNMVFQTNLYRKRFCRVHSGTRFQSILQRNPSLTCILERIFGVKIPPNLQKIRLRRAIPPAGG